MKQSPLPLTDPAGIRGVLFDATGTLIRPAVPLELTYEEAGQRFGSGLTAAEISPRFRAAFGRQEERDVQLGHRSDEGHERRRWEAIVGEIFTDVPEPLAVLDVLCPHFAR